jgi:phytoene synthase
LPNFSNFGPFPPPAQTQQQLARAVRRLLLEADSLYRSGDAGLRYLPFRARVAVATARRVYSAIGDELSTRGCDVTSGRAIVPGPFKAWCVARAFVDASSTVGVKPRATLELRPLRFPSDVLPI